MKKIKTRIQKVEDQLHGDEYFLNKGDIELILAGLPDGYRQEVIDAILKYEIPKEKKPRLTSIDEKRKQLDLILEACSAEISKKVRERVEKRGYRP